MTTFSATVQTHIKASPALAFQHIAPIDPRALFTGYGPLPAVIGTRDQTGAWDTPGQTRTVALSDGSVAEVHARFSDGGDASLEDVFFRATGDGEALPPA